MLRGIERRSIFCDDVDRDDWLERLDRILPESGADCYAWALMTNHVHLVLQTRHAALSRVMARLNTGYALSFNRRHDRVGHLFQNRFKSRLVTSDADLIALVRYVHRNPLAAGMVENLDALERFAWTGHAALCGATPPRTFHSASRALGLFAQDPFEARARLRDFMRAEDEPENTRSSAAAPLSTDTRAFSRATLGPPSATTAGALIDEVARRSGLDRPDVFGRGKHPSRVRARTLLCQRASAELGMTVSQIADWLGISRAAVSRALNRRSSGASRPDPDPRR